ncbi:MAG: lactonase family protein [Planctomycetes bacterium]|nr:lactonase family protein [Planctomycetota bacterium]
MRFRTLCLSLLAFALTAMPSLAADSPAPERLWVFIGTGGGTAKGIYRCEMDVATGKLSNLELAAEASSPNFLAIHPNGKFLYAVGQIKVDGKPQGGVLAFGLDAKTGKLTKLNEEAAGGGGPCHVSVDRAGKNVLIANYGGGSVNAYPVGEDGMLKSASSFIQHAGASGDPKQKPLPRAHSVNVSKDNRFAIVADLGLDKLLVYKLDSATGKLTPNDPPACETKLGAGPRHFAFHPTQPLAFVINELNSTLSSLSYDAEKGTLKTLKTVSTLPEKYQGPNSTAEVVVHPSGKFVYGSNRGHNSIAAFKLDEKTGDLSFISHTNEGIKTPRNFNIDPTGKFMIVGSSASNALVTFKIDQATGELKSTGQSVEVGAPICVKFVPVAK